MNNKKILIALSVIIIILSLNIISAAEDDAVTSADNIQKISDNNAEITVKESLENTVYFNANSQSDIEDGSISYPYKQVNEENIGKVATDSTLYVSSGTYNVASITINKTLSFVGESQSDVIFIADSNNSIFTIDKNTVASFYNFTLRGFTSDTDAAVTNHGNLSVLNVSFENNVGTTSSNKGGAIFNDGNLDITSSLFYYNQASWGAGVYNVANTTVHNSTFAENEIYNVGGALYSTRGNLTVYDSYFTNNKAVSGASIYNAFGQLYVNNTIFYQNRARDFFGGAIYSTGFATTENCVYDSNYANIDGGAITNTNNFTIVNCTFLENAASENGGAIENVPWSENENGNLTIINSSFIANYAKKGGVIINYGKKEEVGETATVTARNTLFELNSAKSGGVIYNEQYVDFEDCVFIDNEAEYGMVIYSNESLIKSLNNNWWGTNKATLEGIGAMPERWRILNFTNSTPLVEDSEVSLQVSLNTLNTGETVSSTIPERNATFSSDKSVFAHEQMSLSTSISNTVEYADDKIAVQVDNQVLYLKSVRNTSIILTVNPSVKYRENVTITGLLVDAKDTPLPNEVVKLLINNGRATLKTDSNGNFNYVYAFGVMGTNNITATYYGSSFYTQSETKTTINVEAQDTYIVLDEIGQVKYGDTVDITGKLLDANANAIAGNSLKLLINNGRATVKTGSDGVFIYTYKFTRSGSNLINVTYAGSNKYTESSAQTTVNVTAMGTQISLDNIESTRRGCQILVKGKLVDENGNAVAGTIKLLINNGRATVKTDENGVFNYTYTATKVGVNNITASYLENNKYLNSTANISVEVSKQNTIVTVDHISNVVQNTYINITGRLMDANGNAVYGSVKLLINNGRATVKTNADGYYSYTYQVKRLGVNNVTVTYLESSNYFESKSETSFVVIKNR